MKDVTVVVPTCGSDEWFHMGNQAAENAEKLGVKVLRVHIPTGTVSQARNAGLYGVKTKYVVFLDADDDLAPNYFEGVELNADVIATAIQYNEQVGVQVPRVWLHENQGYKPHDGPCEGDCLPDGNYIHIGAFIRVEAARAVGGFREYPVYEDWALYLAMQQNGATFDTHYASVYLANTRQNENHRNKAIPLHERNLIHEGILRDLIV
jgi:glycosyltransferase involved in cell wall biosynthesis